MSDSLIQIGILGGTGRMGQSLQKLIETDYSKKSKVICAPKEGESFDGLLACDVVIDFSLPDATRAFAQFVAESKQEKLPAIVIGTTGLKTEEHQILKTAGEKTSVLSAPNFSAGIYALHQIIKAAQPLLGELGYQPVMLETHHKHKKDRPSGTAISLQSAVSPYGPGNVPVHSIHAGEVIGDHEVRYYGKADQITLSHRAQDRSLFARGAIDVALWLSNKRRENPGLTGKLSIDSYYQERVKKS